MPSKLKKIENLVIEIQSNKIGPFRKSKNLDTILDDTLPMIK